MLVPIGERCRTAFQVKRFLEDHKVEGQSFPFDWTITSFGSLSAVLSPSFESSSVLEPQHIFVNHLGSITDRYSGLVFQHRLSRKVVSTFQPEGLEKLIDISPKLLKSAVFDKAKGRFNHTYEKLHRHCRNPKEKIGFVRWCRYGHPDTQFPGAFLGENIFSLHQVLSSFCGHHNFYVLRITSVLEHDEQLKHPVLAYHQYPGIGASVVISERAGHNGDGTVTYKGDDASWTRALAQFISDFGLSDSLDLNYDR